MSMDVDTQQDWQVRYAAKLARAEEAVRLIPPRKRILIGSGAAEPSGLVEAMVTHGTHLAGVIEGADAKPSMTSKMTWLADVSKHLTPTMFGGEARKLKRAARLLVVHIKPRFLSEIAGELEALGLSDLEICQSGTPYHF